MNIVSCDRGGYEIPFGTQQYSCWVRYEPWRELLAMWLQVFHVILLQQKSCRYYWLLIQEKTMDMINNPYETLT